MKIVGSFLIIICAVFLAFITIHREAQHIKNLDELIRLVEYAGRTADFYNSPFSEIICKLKNSSEYSSTDIPGLFSTYIETEINVFSAWNKAVINSSMILSNEEKDALRRFGDEMCRCSGSDIANTVRNTSDFLKESKLNAVEKRTDKAKLKGVVIVSSALAAALVLL